MLKDGKGYLLLETILALSILGIVTASTVPMLYTLYKERFTIKQNSEAIDLLHNSLNDYMLYSTLPDPIVKGTTATFTIRYLPNGGEPKICVSFNGKNSRKYERCGSVKK
ncbi:type II secretion system protein [Fictibacillus sp. Mic-4]|uniref:type II secretion system protein n=1 Tax=Fictibacillus TaxID=1329200 RepID=UPI000423C1D5|nr:type II secretion system protein [Fictibacillus gelatini]